MNKKELIFLEENKKEIENFIVQKYFEMFNKYEEIKKYNIMTLPSFNSIVELKKFLVIFMNFKYPDRFLDWAKNPLIKKTKEFYKIKNNLNALDINQLKFRLEDDVLNFMEFVHVNTISIKNDSTDDSFDISLDADGNISIESINVLKEHNIINNTKKVETIEELHLDLEETLNSEYTSDDLKQMMYINNKKKELMEKIFELAALELLHNNNSMENGYFRAISLLRIVNKEYKLNIKLDDIINPRVIEKNKSMVKI